MSPQYTFRTRRLTIRPISSDDFETCQRTKLASVLSRAEAEGSVLAVSFDDPDAFGATMDHRMHLMERDSDYFFGMFRNGTGDFVGEMMLYDIARGNHQRCEVGTVVHSIHQRQGLATEALRATFRYACRSLGLHRIEGLADPNNHTSIRMCHRAGMRDEGISPREL